MEVGCRYLAVAICVDVLLSYPSVRAAVFRDKNLPEPAHVRHHSNGSRHPFCGGGPLTHAMLSCVVVWSFRTLTKMWRRRRSACAQAVLPTM